MKKLGFCCTISWLAVVVFLALACNAQSQDLFREVDQLKRELSDVKGQLADLRNLVFELRKAMLESAAALGWHSPKQAAPKEAKVVKQEPSVDEAQLTKIICQAVGKFFSEAESVLRSSDSSRAESGMRKALRTLNDSLQDYSKTHRASKLLNIYEGLAWDTYSAVELQGSVAGNQKFLKVLAEHKRKYIDTCPKE
jgi:hypothetical protein